MFPNYVFAQGLPSSMPPFASMGDLGLASAGASTHPGHHHQHHHHHHHRHPGGLGHAPPMMGAATRPLGAPPPSKPPRGKVACEHPGCGKEFAWAQDLAKHVRRAHSGEAPKFQCSHDGCEKRFYERKLLVAHERTHTDERPFACAHPGCGKTFRARNSLTYHVKAMHSRAETLRCDVDGCAFTTKKPELLASHRAKHARRVTERAWKTAQRGEVQDAVKGVKDEAREKAGELARATRALHAEQRAHARAAKELRALAAECDELRRKTKSDAEEIDRLRPGGGGGGDRARAKRKRADGGGEGEGGEGGDGTSIDAAGGGGDGEGPGPGPARAKTRARAPEVVLLDGVNGKHPMLAVGDPLLPVDQIPGPHHPQSVCVSVNGRMRRVQPVCAQALPWSTSFIGCPGITCGDPTRGGRGGGIGIRNVNRRDGGGAGWTDFTVLFKPNGERDCGNRKSTPLEVEHAKDPAKFLARSTSCPWSSERAQETLERATDPVATRALLDEFAPKRPLKVKRVDGQCEGCYAAHVTLAARMRAKNPKKRDAAAASASAAAAADPGT